MCHCNTFFFLRNKHRESFVHIKENILSSEEASGDGILIWAGCARVEYLEDGGLQWEITHDAVEGVGVHQRRRSAPWVSARL